MGGELGSHLGRRQRERAVELPPTDRGAKVTGRLPIHPERECARRCQRLDGGCGDLTPGRALIIDELSCFLPPLVDIDLNVALAKPSRASTSGTSVSAAATGWFGGVGEAPGILGKPSTATTTTTMAAANRTMATASAADQPMSASLRVGVDASALC